MLIVNEDQLRVAGVESLEGQCIYCSRPLAAYLLIMCDDVSQTVYHLTCALELASDLLADVFTFFRPPAPCPPLFVLTSPEEAGRGSEKGGRSHAVVNGYPPD